MKNSIRRQTASVLSTLVCVLAIVSCCAQEPSNESSAPETDEKQSPAVDRGPAPPNPFPRTTKLKSDIFSYGSGWLNTDRPISLTDLKGKIVVLDFWTYCCINCMHVLPDLKFLEQKYGKELVVIGVHSAKFDNEKDAAQIEAAIQRYEIDHPVINDSEMILWNRFGVRAWPTLALIDPEGQLVGIQPGEGNRILFDRIIAQMVKYHRWKGTLNEEPIRFREKTRERDLTKLHFPGKVLIDESSDRLFVSDSSNHRVVVTDLEGRFLKSIGAAEQGFKDGDFNAAAFNRPQGMALVDNQLFVADTDNHAIRIVDFETEMVTTLMGSGVQAKFGATGGAIDSAKLNSPWDIVVSEGRMFIAMAGAHQIWSHELNSAVVEVFAGNGAEDVVNGRRQTAAFAQPSDLAFSADGARMFVADSEGSAIRRIDMDTGFVSTVVGTSGLPRGQSLFAFGDVDGIGSDVRFQHPLAVTAVPSGLLVADSYNHKVKSIGLPSRETSTWIGNGRAGGAVSPASLAEPGDIEVDSQFAYIADTNNHRILKVNLKNQAVVQLPIEIPAAAEEETPATDQVQPEQADKESEPEDP